MSSVQSPIFLPSASFSADDFPGAREISARRGRFVLFEGEQHKGHCYLILEGNLDVRLVTSSGHETMLYRLGPGDLVGELGMFGQAARTASILAIKPCRLLQITPQQFSSRFADEDFKLRMMSLFLTRYLRSHDVICRLGQPTIAAKLCRYLLSLPEWKEHQGSSLNVSLGSHSELAQMLSCQRETVTRAFKVLQQLNILENLENRNYRIDRTAAQLFMDDEA
ncbi:MAG: Crp/Fnr family transcriptional regulator [Mariprofundaceae bacterium]